MRALFEESGVVIVPQGDERLVHGSRYAVIEMSYDAGDRVAVIGVYNLNNEGLEAAYDHITEATDLIG